MSGMVKKVYSSDFLAHHGILGQKWGVRRFQNADGTLTEAGRKRYKNDSENIGVKVKRVNKFDYPISDEINTPQSKAFIKDILEGRYNEEIYNAITDEYYPQYVKIFPEWQEMINLEIPGAIKNTDKLSKNDFKNALKANGFNSGSLDEWNGHLSASVYLYASNPNNDNLELYNGHVFGVYVTQDKDRNGKHVNPKYITLEG